MRWNQHTQVSVTNNHTGNSSAKTDPVTVNGVTSSQYGAGLFHWLHLGKFGAGSMQSDAVITGWFHYCVSTAQVSALLVVFITLRGIRTEQRADPRTVHCPAASLHICVPYIRKYACWSRGDDSWRQQQKMAGGPAVVLLSSTHCDPCQSSSRSSHTHLPKHRVFTSLSLHFAYVNMPPKGAALGELVTKQPEITAKFAHKFSLYMSS